MEELKKEQILEALKNFQSSPTQLFIIDENEIKKSNAIILEYFTKQLKMKGIFISLEDYFNDVRAYYKNYELDTKKIFFISNYFKDSDSIEEGYCLKEPAPIIEISVLLTDLTNSGKFDFILFDSLSRLLHFYNVNILEKFIFYMIKKAEFHKLYFFANTPDNESSSFLIPSISNFWKKINYLGKIDEGNVYRGSILII